MDLYTNAKNLKELNAFMKRTGLEYVYIGYFTSSRGYKERTYLLRAYEEMATYMDAINIYFNKQEDETGLSQAYIDIRTTK